VKPINPRLLPSDEEIAVAIEVIGDPGWRWIYGMMATYGLRNHEVFFLDHKDFPVVRVRAEAKTKERSIKPLYPEWAERWDLHEAVYPEKISFTPETSNALLGGKITKWFDRRMQFSPYNLRHCYSRRCALFDIEPSTAAQLMGHTLFIHETVYKAWVGEKVYLDAVDRLMERDNRPQPPNIDLNPNATQ
jgi:integrase